jgi:hypothetical protein
MTSNENKIIAQQISIKLPDNTEILIQYKYTSQDYLKLMFTIYFNDNKTSPYMIGFEDFDINNFHQTVNFFLLANLNGNANMNNININTLITTLANGDELYNAIKNKDLSSLGIYIIKSISNMIDTEVQTFYG